MALSVPTTKEQAATNLANFEASVNQTAPLAEKSFLRTLSAQEAMMQTGMYKLGTDAAKQNLALTATEEDLKNLGLEYGVEYKNATATVLAIQAPASPATTVTTDNAFVGDSNGVRYTVDANGSEAGGVIDLSVTAEVGGTVGNLSAPSGFTQETLTIQTPVAGVNNLWTVESVTTEGTDDEDIEVYRSRVLSEIRTVGGGGNAADYKRWAELPESVLRAYPYAGNPISVESSVPGERTVYIETPTSLEPDGIPTQAILDDVRDSITTNEDTGLANQPLGLVDSTLYVEAIIRTPFTVLIPNLVIDASKQSAMEAEMLVDLDVHFRSLLMFVDGIDPQIERNDTITASTVNVPVQGVLTKYGATSTQISVIGPAGTIIEYLLAQGEMAKLGGVSYT
jgi:hypothetical protein